MSKRFVFPSVVLFVGVLCLIGFTAQPAVAVKEFRDAFKAKYVKPDSTVASDVALADAVSESNCQICHVGKSKKARNDYGKQIGKLLNKKDKKDTAKIQAAMDKVAKLKSDPSDDASPTFGEKIASGKLPAAE